MATTGGAVPAVMAAERSLVAKREPSVLRWRIAIAGRLSGAAWLEYEETRRGALAFVASCVHPSLRERGVPETLVARVAQLHPRSHAWYVAHDVVDRDTRDALQATAVQRDLPLRRI